MDNPFQYDPLTDGTKGVVCIGDKIIVYRRDHKPGIPHPGELDLPGGEPEGNETPFETFARETYEEFRVRVEPEHIVYAKRYAMRSQLGRFAWYLVAKLPADAAQSIVFGDEGTDPVLMPVEEFLARTDAWPVLQERTADYLKATGTT